MRKKISEKRYLFDVNVLLALANPLHEHHNRTWLWFKANGDRNYATCPLTQLGFLRIITLPASRLGVTVKSAHRSLQLLTSEPNHEFWPDEISASSLNPAGVYGHQQWNDAYLLALARHRSGIVATFDKGFAELARAQQSPLELIEK